MSDDDIFSQFGDGNKTLLNGGGGDKTIIKPMPGGKRSNIQATPSSIPPPQMAQVPVSSLHNVLDATNNNPIISVASPLLSLLNRLSQTHQHNDIKGLYTRTVQEIRNYENNAKQKGLDNKQILIARYILCSAIDEMVLNTPWGSTSFWPSKSLLSTFHKESTGGQKFFTILEQLQQSPGANINLLELIAICLSLGFQGKYRIEPNGLNFIETIRTQLHQQIVMIRGEYNRELSQSTKGIQFKRAADRNVPLWVIGAVTGALIIAAYIGFNISLNNDASPLLDTINSIQLIDEPQKDQ